MHSSSMIPGGFDKKSLKVEMKSENIFCDLKRMALKTPEQWRILGCDAQKTGMLDRKNKLWYTLSRSSEAVST